MSISKEIWRRADFAKRTDSRLDSYCTGACGLERGVFVAAKPRLAVPNSFKLDDLSGVHLDQSALTDRYRTGRDWAGRSDFFDEAAGMLIELSSNLVRPRLYCYSEYSKPIDPALETRPHATRNSSVFLTAEVGPGCTQDIARVMRQSRSRVCIGVVSAEGRGPCSLQVGDLFFFDLFDGDMLAITDLEFTQAQIE